MSKIETLVKDNEHIYPRTVEKAIYDDNGVRLDNKVNQLDTRVTDIEEGLAQAKDDLVKVTDRSIYYNSATSLSDAELINNIGELLKNLPITQSQVPLVIAGLNKDSYYFSGTACGWGGYFEYTISTYSHLYLCSIQGHIISYKTVF